MNYTDKWKEETKRRIAVMQAYADGREIQVQARDRGTDRWSPVSAPLWEWASCDYRVKPITIEYRVALMRHNGPLGPRCSTHACSREEDQNEPREEWRAFVRWLTDWTTVEI